MADPVRFPPARVGRRAILVGATALAVWSRPSRQTHAQLPGDRRYICSDAGCLPYIYDPAEGDPRRGVPPGTPFSAVPDDWICPICGVGKHRFVRYG